MTRIHSTRALAALPAIVLAAGWGLVAETGAGPIGFGGAGQVLGMAPPSVLGGVFRSTSVILPQDEGIGGAVEAVEPETPPAIIDGDSALAALTLAASQTSDRDLAGRALMRAGFIAYVKGDLVQAEALFAGAGDKGVPDASLWRGLALLADDRVDDAEKALKRAMSSASDSTAFAAASLGLAACDLAAGRVKEGASRCRGIVGEEGEGYTSALILLQRCLSELGERGRGATALERLAERHPMAYEVAVIRNAEELSDAETPVQTEALDEGVAIGEGRAEPAGEGAPSDGTLFSGAPVEGRPAQGEVLEEEIVQEEAAETPERPAAQPGFSVQVGAFSDIRNAETLAAGLTEKGYDAVRVEVERKADSVFHCVRVGRFASRSDAALLASILEEKESLSTRIVRTTIRSPGSQTEGQ